MNETFFSSNGCGSKSDPPFCLFSLSLLKVLAFLLALLDVTSAAFERVRVHVAEDRARRPNEDSVVADARDLAFGVVSKAKSTSACVVLHPLEVVQCTESCILNEAAAALVGLRLHRVLVVDTDRLGTGGSPHIP